MSAFFIQADVFGKKKYWEFVGGLHSGKGKLKGFAIYKTKKEANDVINLLKKVFHSGIKFEVKPFRAKQMLLTILILVFLNLPPILFGLKQRDSE